MPKEGPCQAQKFIQVCKPFHVHISVKITTSAKKLITFSSVHTRDFPFDLRNSIQVIRLVTVSMLFSVLNYLLGLCSVRACVCHLTSGRMVVASARSAALHMIQQVKRTRPVKIGTEKALQLCTIFHYVVVARRHNCHTYHLAVCSIRCAAYHKMGCSEPLWPANRDRSQARPPELIGVEHSNCSTASALVREAAYMQSLLIVFILV